MHKKSEQNWTSKEGWLLPAWPQVIYKISAQYVKTRRRKVWKTVYFQYAKFKRSITPTKIDDTRTWSDVHSMKVIYKTWFPQIMTYLFQGLFKDFWGTFSRSFQGLFFIRSNIHSRKNDQQWTFQIRHTQTIWSWVCQKNGGGGDLGRLKQFC